MPGKDEQAFLRTGGGARPCGSQCIGRDDTLGAITDDKSGACGGGHCGHFIVIECSR